MKKILSNKSFTLYLLAIIVAATLGITISNTIFNLDGVDIWVKGILGASLIFIVIVFYFSPSKPLDLLNDTDLVIDVRLIFKHSVMYFFIFIIFTWAVQYVIDAVHYLINLI